MPTIESWKDLQIYLSRTKLVKSSLFHYGITDFVTGMVEEGVIVGGNGSHQVVLKSGLKKPKLENVTRAKWCIVNNAILYRLVGESNINRIICSIIFHTAKKVVNCLNVSLWCQVYNMIGTIDNSKPKMVSDGGRCSPIARCPPYHRKTIKIK